MYDGATILGGSHAVPEVETIARGVRWVGMPVVEHSFLTWNRSGSADVVRPCRVSVAGPMLNWN